VKLEGGASVSPEVIPHAPGTVTHVAPSGGRATMTIGLTANSRRGRDHQELKVSTLRPFRIEGGAGDMHFTGLICDLGEKFEIRGDGTVATFVPSSPQGGSFSYGGTYSSFGVKGEGTYTVAYNGDTPVGITAPGHGSVKTPMGTMSSSGAWKLKLTPSDTDGPCN
jgi:hypothetical protein